MKVFEVVNGGTAIVNGRTFCVVQEGNGVPDGIRCDAKGNLWACCGDGINICTSGPLPLPPRRGRGVLRGCWAAVASHILYSNSS